MTFRALVVLFLRDLVRRRMLWTIVLVTLGLLAVSYGIGKTMQESLGRGESWDLATRRASSNLDDVAEQVRRWLPVLIVLVSAIVAPESRRNGTTQFALSCGVRRDTIAGAQFCALSIIVLSITALIHIGFAVTGLRNGAMTTSEAAFAWLSLVLPVLGLSAAVFALSLTASAIEAYLVFLGAGLVTQTLPQLTNGLPKWCPRIAARAVDNFGLLLPDIEPVITWPRLTFGAGQGGPYPESVWPGVHLAIVVVLWITIGLWRHRRHDFGSRTAVK